MSFSFFSIFFRQCLPLLLLLGFVEDALAQRNAKLTKYHYAAIVEFGSALLYNKFGVFYRYNFNDLGTARFTGSDYPLDMKPSGNILGGYFRVVLPAGRKKVKLPDPPPPADIIYHPRMNSLNV